MEVRLGSNGGLEFVMIGLLTYLMTQLVSDELSQLMIRMSECKICYKFVNSKFNPLPLTGYCRLQIKWTLASHE